MNVIMLYHMAILPVPLTIPVSLIFLKPSLVFLVVGKQQSALAFFEVVDKRAVVVVVSSRIVADSMAFSLLEMTFIDVSFLIKKPTFSLHFSIQKISLVYFSIRRF